MTVEQLFALQDSIRANAPNDGIVLGSNSMCGLYDPWNGAGSLLNIALDKEVILPYKYIDSALPDGGRGYGVANVYGMSCGFGEPTMLATNLKAYNDLNESKKRVNSMKYYVTYKVEARYIVEVEAVNLEEARKKASEEFSDADFGVAEDIDGEDIIVEDENGNYLWER